MDERTEQDTGKNYAKDRDELLDDSNPNTSTEGPPGGLGVSSERIVAPGGVEGTGTHGTATGRTHGTLDTSEVGADGTPSEEADAGTGNAV